MSVSSFNVYLLCWDNGIGQSLIVFNKGITLICQRLVAPIINDGGDFYVPEIVKGE